MEAQSKHTHAFNLCGFQPSPMQVLASTNYTCTHTDTCMRMHIPRTHAHTCMILWSISSIMFKYAHIHANTLFHALARSAHAHAAVRPSVHPCAHFSHACTCMIFLSISSLSFVLFSILSKSLKCPMAASVVWCSWPYARTRACGRTARQAEHQDSEAGCTGVCASWMWCSWPTGWPHVHAHMRMVTTGAQNATRSKNAGPCTSPVLRKPWPTGSGPGLSLMHPLSRQSNCKPWPEPTLNTAHTQLHSLAQTRAQLLSLAQTRTQLRSLAQTRTNLHAL